MILRPFLVLAVLGLPAAAQSELERLDRAFGLTGRLAFDLGSLALDAETPVAPDPRLSVAASLAETPAPSRPVDRSDLEGTVEVLPEFGAMPGGIVLGTAATTPADWGDFELALDRRGLALVTATGRHYFPEARPEVIRACVAFVLRGDGSDVVIDIDQSRAEIAPELRNTALAPALAHADRAPQRWMTELPWCKTVIVDEAITFAPNPAGGDLLISAALEVRVYVPLGADQGAPCLISSERIDAGSGVGAQASARNELVEDLGPVIDLAGFLGVLRWAAERQPGCLDGLLGQSTSGIEPSLSLASNDLLWARFAGNRTTAADRLDWPSWTAPREPVSRIQFRSGTACRR